MKNYPSKEVQKFGEDLSEALMTATLRKSMGGLGGCKNFNIQDFHQEFQPYIQEYLKENHNSAAIIYSAMKTKEQEMESK